MNEPSSPAPTTSSSSPAQSAQASSTRSSSAPAHSMRSRRTANWAKPRNSDDGCSRYLIEAAIFHLRNVCVRVRVRG